MLDDDVFFNWTTPDIMIVSWNGLPFQVGHKIHLDTFQFLFPTLSSPDSLVVDINVSTGLFQFHLHLPFSNLISFSTQLPISQVVFIVSLKGFP